MSRGKRWRVSRDVLVVEAEDYDELAAHLERIQKAAKTVFEFQWHDNDEAAVKALEKLRGAING
jgi:hypothetical protein